MEQKEGGKTDGERLVGLETESQTLLSHDMCWEQRETCSKSNGPQATSRESPIGPPSF